MSLIRNGGFERGNTQFWEVLQGGTLEIDNINQKYGNYCGKFTADGSGDGIILSSDYIDVKPYQILEAGLWLNSATTRTIYSILYAYDADYSFIEKIYGVNRGMNGTYLSIATQFLIPAGCAYVRFGIEIISSAADEIFYLDGGIVDILTKDSAACGAVELLPLSDYYSSSGTANDSKEIKQFSTYYAELQCTFVGGTSPTLDVDVREMDIFNRSVLLASFPQVTAATVEMIDLPHCLGSRLYLIYTIGGTDPEFDFGVSVIGKG